MDEFKADAVMTEFVTLDEIYYHDKMRCFKDLKQRDFPTGVQLKILAFPVVKTGMTLLSVNG